MNDRIRVSVHLGGSMAARGPQGMEGSASVLFLDLGDGR